MFTAADMNTLTKKVISKREKTKDDYLPKVIKRVIKRANYWLKQYAKYGTYEWHSSVYGLIDSLDYYAFKEKPELYRQTYNGIWENFNSRGFYIAEKGGSECIDFVVRWDDDSRKRVTGSSYTGGPDS